MSAHRAAILIVARDNPAAFWAQIEALVACDLADDVQVVILDDASGPETRSLLARLEGDVTILRSERPIGRRAALATATRAASADVCIALSAIARPCPGFVEPLVEAVRAGAGLAAPVLETAAGDVWGYRLAGDGSLWPVTSDQGSPDALALDCLAADRRLWLERQPAFTAREGHYEVLLAQAARGNLVVAGAARSRRVSEGPAASVIVCSRDRADEVTGCVDACVAHGVTAAGCELIVVDNGSTDGTAEKMRGLADASGGAFRVVDEPQAGLSRARNAGAAAAANEILIYLDDDARPAPGWIESIRDAFTDPRLAVAGGPIHGLWPEERPADWPPRGTEALFSVLSHGDADVTFPGHAEVFGANWGVRREALAGAGGFDPDVGLRPGSRINGDEYTIAHRIAARGLGAARYVAGAAVGHRVAPARVDEGYMVARGFTNGVEIISYEEDLGGTDATRAAHAERAGRVLATLELPAGDVEQTLQAIHALAIPVEQRVQAGNALGRLTRAATAMGIEAVAAGSATITLRPEHAQGLLRLPPRPPARRPAPHKASLVFMFPDMPDPNRSAGHRRAFEMALAMREAGYDTTLACLRGQGLEATAERLHEAGIRTYAADAGDDLAALLHHGFDVAIVSFYSLAEQVIPLLRAVAPRTRIAVDSVDVHFLRLRREAELAGDAARLAESERVREAELAVYRASDLVVAVTPEERALLTDLVAGVPVEVIGNVHRPHADVPGPLGRRGALFVGSYFHPPNLDAVRFLCNEILPALRSHGYDQEIAVAGTAMTDEIRWAVQAAGGVAPGFLPSVEDDLARRRVSLAPLRFGAGLKGKVGEAFACGVPVVGTSIAAEGFQDAEKAMLIADTASDIAAAIVRLTRDDVLWQRLSAGGVDLIARTLGPDACRESVENVVEILAPNANRRAVK